MKPITKAVLWILLVFLAGTLFGGGMTSLLMRPVPAAAGAARERGDSQSGRSRGSGMLDRMTQAIDLDSGQQEQVRAILEDSRRRYHEIEARADKEKRKQYGKVRHENRDRIRALLRETQVARFEAFLSLLHEEWEQRRSRRQAAEQDK